MYLPHVCTYLSNGSEELDTCHPLIKTESGLSRKVVEVGDKALHDVFEAGVAAL